MSTVEPLGEEVLATLVAAAADAVVVADASGCIRYWNAAAEEMFGHPHEEVIGASLDSSSPRSCAGATGRAISG
jgi:PAS domain S-box-containing protein